MNHQDTGHLVDGYNRMMDRIRSFIDNPTEDGTPTLQTAMDKAITLAQDRHELTRPEALKIANTIKHDFNAAAEELMETNSAFTEWLRDDLDELEHKVLQLFLSVAHNTRAEINQFLVAKN